MNKVEQLTSPQAVERLLSLITFEGPILDTTYGSGVFWKGSSRQVVGCDMNPSRAKDVCCSFYDLPFADDTFELVVFDPPFHPFVGSHEEERFSGMGRNEKELRYFFEVGIAESWRVSSKYLLVKCQDYVHNHRPQWMPLWATGMLGEPYEWLIATRPSKLTSSLWKTVRSLRRNHADYLLFSKLGTARSAAA